MPVTAIIFFGKSLKKALQAYSICFDILLTRIKITFFLIVIKFSLIITVAPLLSASRA